MNSSISAEPSGIRTSTLRCASLESGSPRFTQSTLEGFIGLPCLGETSGRSNGLAAMRRSSSSSASTHSTMPFDTRSLNVHSPDFSLSRSDVVSVRLPPSSMRRGLSILPLSVLMYMSRFAESCLRLTSGRILPCRLLRLNWVTSLLGSLCSPKMSPFTWILEPSAHPSGLELTPASARSALTSSSGTSSETSIICAAFLTRPQFWPSGVSLGHSLPHCVG